MSNISPVPQQVSTTGATFAAPTVWHIVADVGRSDSYIINALQRIGINEDPSASFTITIGVKGDKSVKKVAKLIPDPSGGYTLALTPSGAIVAGRDERGAVYGVQSLATILSGGQGEECTITDYPDVALRGVVEGFYGTPWTHAARLAQLDFYGKNKLNIHLYGPKDAPYHSTPDWRKPYPPAEARQLMG